MKRTKKILSLALCAVLLVAGTVATTVAYLTSTTGVVNNTFQVGKVLIKLDEAPVDLYGVEVSGDRTTENTYKLIPGHTYKKDPLITVDAESEKCYLFVKIQNDIYGLEKAGDTTIAAQMSKLGWTDTGENGIYVYNTVVSANATVKVFESFTLADNADVASVNTSNAAIKVIACAVQSDGLTQEQALDVVPSDFVIE